MFLCHRCQVEARDGVQCTLCLKSFDFPCAGITETGYRKLGDRKATWKCSTCKAGLASPSNPPPGRAAQGDLENIHQELRKLTEQLASLPLLMEKVKTIQADISDLKSMKDEIAGVQKSLDYVHGTVDELTVKLEEVDKQIESLQKTKEDVSRFEMRLGRLESSLREGEQRSRLNNIEIKGVPVIESENLFAIVAKIGGIIKCEVSKDQINYVARVPQRNNKDAKNIIISMHNRYLRDDFIAAAKKHKSLTASDLGINDNGASKIFVNDHLTFENKQLLNRAKILSKEKDFSFIWVKNCKILVKKNSTSPTHAIMSELDLKKIC